MTEQLPPGGADGSNPPRPPLADEDAEFGAARRSFTRQIDCSGRDVGPGTSRSSGQLPQRGSRGKPPRGGRAA